ncbi:MAG: hypothetical protein JWO48_640 [Bryobacterales bacterium]|nr:hypothetical protein [Bryobacterales bacterium]
MLRTLVLSDLHQRPRFVIARLEHDQASSRVLHTTSMAMRESLTISLIITYAFAVSAAAWIARFDLRTNNTRGVVFAILMSTFACSALHARYATLWALLLGLAVPIAETYSAAAGAPRPGLGIAVSLAILALITLTIGFTGAAIGVLFRKVIRA